MDPSNEQKAKVKAKENKVEPKERVRMAKGNETKTTRRGKSRRPVPLDQAGFVKRQPKKKKTRVLPRFGTPYP